jgi:hypothetical protein
VQAGHAVERGTAYNHKEQNALKIYQNRPLNGQFFISEPLKIRVAKGYSFDQYEAFTVGTDSSTARQKFIPANAAPRWQRPYHAENKAYPALAGGLLIQLM